MRRGGRKEGEGDGGLADNLRELNFLCIESTRKYKKVPKTAVVP